MRPMTYTADLQKIRVKLVSCLQGIVFGAIVAGLAVLLHMLAPEDPLAPIFFAAAAVLVLLSIIAAAKHVRWLPVADNRLSIGGQGLVLVQRGRVRRWRWAEVSEARRRGEFAVLTEVRDGRQSDVRIDDIYQTPLADIVARINNARSQAAAEAPAAAGDISDLDPPRPLRFHTAPAVRRRRLAKDLGLSVIGTLAVPAMFLLLMKELPGDGLSDVFSTVLIVGVASIACFLSAVHILTSGRSGNFLQLTDEGLAWVQRWSLVRQWRWQDLSTFEVREGRDAGAQTLAFSAADDGKPFRHMGLTALLWFRSSSPGQISFVIEEAFDAPAGQIVDTINARRAQALADTPAAQTVAPSATTAGSGRPVGFQKNVQDVRSLGAVGWMLSFGGFVWIPIVLILGWPFDAVLDMQGPAQSFSHWLQRFLGMLVPIGLIAEILFLMREIAPADNALSLDRNGLTLTRGGRKKLWSWRDLSAFQVEARKVLGLFGPRGVIVFGAPGGRDPRSRFLRLWYALTGRAPAMVIEDVYDTPLDDIAATLNRYRADCAGGGPNTVPAE